MNAPAPAPHVGPGEVVARNKGWRILVACLGYALWLGLLLAFLFKAIPQNLMTFGTLLVVMLVLTWPGLGQPALTLKGWLVYAWGCLALVLGTLLMSGPQAQAVRENYLLYFMVWLVCLLWFNHLRHLLRPAPGTAQPS